MSVIGKATINPFMFYFGKACGYIAYIFLIPAFFNVPWLPAAVIGWPLYAAYALYAMGVVIIFAGLFNLGDSTRVGLPPEETKLKTAGIYRITRNPIYVGLHLGNIAAVIITGNIWIAVMAVISFITYQYIIEGEEKFLAERFGEQYLNYRSKVARYLFF